MDHQIKCTECGKTYSTNGNLRKHINKSHDSDESLAPRVYKSAENYAYNCNCGKNFNNKRHFLYHLKQHEPECIIKTESDIQNEESNLSKQCPMCTYSNQFKIQLLSHFETTHDIIIKEHSLEFSSKENFSIWKDQLEKNTNSCYVKQSTKVFKNHTTIYYICNRSGNYIAKNKDRKRALKTQGSNKINAYCPAGINLTIDSEEKYAVKYIETHVGHSNDLGHLFLSSSERNELATKIAGKIPFDVILNDVRDSVTDSSLHRIHLLTKKDLYNIETSFNLCPDSVRHPNDCISVEAWINEINSKEEMCVLFYKPQDTESEEHPQLKSEDFMLIIMNQPQCDTLMKYGNDCICIDGTHGMNNYNFELLTLLIIDDMRQGFPCAFCITNRTDKETSKIFFSYIEKYAGRISCTVFMSDMAESFYNAWVEIMELPKLRLFCSWHVDRAWRKNLSKIPNKEKQVAIYKQLRTLLEERDQSAFEQMLNEFCNEMLNEPGTKEFGIYFIENYTKNYKSWAHCFRLHAGLNTNMHLERMHGVLKYTYLNGKNVKRLDKVITALIKFVKDKLFDRLITVNKGKISSKLKDIRRRHKTSLTLNMDLLLQSETGWEVKSCSSTNYEIYYISEINVSCECQLICNDCLVCIHRYSCSCIDSAIKWVMCKHIHLVCRFRHKNEANTIQKQPSTEDELIQNNDLHIKLDNCTSESEYLGSVLTQKKNWIIESSEIQVNKQRKNKKGIYTDTGGNQDTR